MRGILLWKASEDAIRLQGDVSIPLRGIKHWKAELMKLAIAQYALVSIPLRGIKHWKARMNETTNPLYSFQSPCGEFSFGKASD
ncbi:hypothetical protein M595_3561 [Lyngbya aestuarii BL J]|uniref:Uncharacterized protein n=1 Tax=Lyngbya aestuarii BL J TaxID=1348334 RepID=U7QJ67_9CYAN|nr:hypothetical protein M595_3561 [Lyngbya aestuarii BL J]